MLKNSSVLFKIKSPLAIFLIMILFSGLLIGSVHAEWAGHLVISAAQITEGEGKTNHDYIEIYNPTSDDINLKGYRLVKRTKTGTNDTSIKSWTDDVIIKAHGWRLWASSDDEAYSASLSADDFTKQTIAADNGIAIRFGALDTGDIVDLAAWGESENIFKESVAAPNPGAKEVLVRGSGIIGAGNGEDTNNNAADFSIVSVYTPHSSQSVPMPVLENTSPNDPALTPTPIISPVSEAGLTSSQSSGIAQKAMPIADAGSDKEAVIGENLDFDASDSFDPAGKELGFVWDFGDKTSAKGANVAHFYSAVGDYEVILKADNGESIAEDRLRVKITTPEFSDKIIINEILPNPIGADKDGEWIELYNSGESKVNLKGWIIDAEGKSGGKQYIFTGDSFIEPKNYLIIKRGSSGLVLVNENGKAALKWSADKIISEVSYDSAKEGKSYAFYDNKWKWSDEPTPGKSNSIISASSVAPKQKNKSNLAPNTINKEQANKTAFQTQDVINESDVGDFEQIKNATAQPVNIIGIEDFLDRLIAEKVEKAILKAKEEEAASLDKMVTVVNMPQKDTNIAVDTEPDREKYTASIGLNNGSCEKNTRNNPWFYGDLALSALSLFLVWRYQEVRKKLKN